MTTPTTTQPTAEKDPRRWAALAFIALAQLMIVLDGTIVNIALPSIQTSLDISDGDRQWVLTAYTLAFGSLLLLGGRIADYTGRKRAFIIGLLGFAAASALGGAAPNFGTLLASRALQGAFGALLAPTALSLMAVLFTDSRERAKAFGVFGAIAAGGSAVGLVLGGVLTEYLDWRWCLYVNIPIAVGAAFGAFRTLSETKAKGKARFDIPGIVLITAGLVAIVYATSEAEKYGWGAGRVVGLFAVGVALLVVFVFVETKVPSPALPLKIVLDRTRGAIYICMGLAVIGMFGMFLVLTFYFQVVLDYSPAVAGCAFLPMTASVLVAGGGLSARLVPKFAPRLLIVPGLLLAATGLGLLTRLTPDTSYATGVLPSLILVGFGMGLVMPAAMNYATHGVRPEESGAASATVNTMQQVGASIGIALLNTIAATATADYAKSHPPQGPGDKFTAMVEGFTSATAWGAAILAGTAVIVGLLLNQPKPEHKEEEAAPAVMHV